MIAEMALDDFSLRVVRQGEIDFYAQFGGQIADDFRLKQHLGAGVFN